MKRVFLLNFLCLIIGLSSCFGQQFPAISHNMFTKTVINPAYTGMEADFSALALIRRQWENLEGAPTSYIFSGDANFKLFGLEHGIGFSAISEKIGFTEDLNLKLSYSYHQKIGKNTLSLGIEGGLYAKNLNADWEYIENNDPNIPKNDKRTSYDLGAGLFYKAKKFYLGISALHLNEAKFTFGTEAPYLKRHYFFSSGYTFKLPIPLLELQPNILLKYDEVILQYYVNTRVLYNKNFWAGVSYRANDAVIAMIGFSLLKGMKISYSYDIITSNIKTYNYGSHELMLSYSFNIRKEKSPKRYKSVRFL